MEEVVITPADFLGLQETTRAAKSGVKPPGLQDTGASISHALIERPSLQHEQMSRSVLECVRLDAAFDCRIHLPLPLISASLPSSSRPQTLGLPFSSKRMRPQAQRWRDSRESTLGRRVRSSTPKELQRFDGFSTLQVPAAVLRSLDHSPLAAFGCDGDAILRKSSRMAATA